MQRQHTHLKSICGCLSVLNLALLSACAGEEILSALEGQSTPSNQEPEEQRADGSAQNASEPTLPNPSSQTADVQKPPFAIEAGKECLAGAILSGSETLINLPVSSCISGRFHEHCVAKSTRETTAKMGFETVPIAAGSEFLYAIPETATLANNADEGQPAALTLIVPLAGGGLVLDGAAADHFDTNCRNRTRARPSTLGDLDFARDSFFQHAACSLPSGTVFQRDLRSLLERSAEEQYRLTWPTNPLAGNGAGSGANDLSGCAGQATFLNVRSVRLLLPGGNALTKRLEPFGILSFPR